jgi:hypothetical protein
MARLGHSTPQAALRYQHAAAGRDKAIAARLSELAEAGRGCLICTPGWLIPCDIAWRTTYYSALWDLRPPIRRYPSESTRAQQQPPEH